MSSTYPEEDRIKVTSIDKERAYLNDRFSPVGIYATDSYKVIITYIKAGQYLTGTCSSRKLIPMKPVILS